MTKHVLYKEDTESAETVVEWRLIDNDEIILQARNPGKGWWNIEILGTGGLDLCRSVGVEGLDLEDGAIKIAK